MTGSEKVAIYAFEFPSANEICKLFKLDFEMLSTLRVNWPLITLSTVYYFPSTITVTSDVEAGAGPLKDTVAILESESKSYERDTPLVSVIKGAVKTKFDGTVQTASSCVRRNTITFVEI